MLNELRAYLKGQIADATGLPVYFFRANDDATMPYIVFEFTDMSVNDLVTKQYSLSIDIWDKSSPKAICNASDNLEKTFRHFKDTNDNFTIAIYSDTGSGFVDDTDKDIYRINAGYEMQVTFKEEL